MKVIALIPARYNASRFPGKLMALLNGKPVIRHTYEAAINIGLFDEVIVVTDSDEIYNEIVTNGGKAVMSLKEHECGSDRIAEAAKNIEADIVVNVQGDEPFIQKDSIQRLLEVFKNDNKKEIALASLMQELKDMKLVQDPNYVKVAVDKNNFALFFSRAPIPYPRNENVSPIYYEHVGVYAFRKEALIEFSQTPMGFLENIEKIECLRYLENGKKMKMITTDYMGIEIDTPEDLDNAEKVLKGI